jgi:transcriptional regulator with XRE-family HTH domain
LKTTPNPIDAHVGAKVKMHRLLAGMSQKQLGELIGVTFQQVQKYENGANRIGASRLQHIAIALKAPLGAFFDGAAASASSGSEANELGAFAAEFLATADGIRFFRAFRQVSNQQARATIIDLMVMLAANSDERLTEQKTKNVRSAA